MNSPHSRRGRAEGAAHSASLKRAMRHDGGHLGNLHGRPADPNKPKLPTAAQRRAVSLWPTAYLPAHSPASLAKALEVCQGHPDAQSAGYSQAKAAVARLTDYLASLPKP